MRSIFGKLRGTDRRRPDTVLGRLARDVRGNTLAIMCAALIPFCGLVGGGIDISRMYITKTRLQHACDAGALAGRKQMGSGMWGTDDDTAARQYFNANFTSTGMYGSGPPTIAYSENAGKVTGAASATLPMTLMRVLGKTQDTLSVTCDAEMRLPNTDIMFVLDTTGSMADIPASDTMPKIDSLKVAVKCFYEILARLDTDATCTTGTPSGGTGTQVQIRFGFVPYATNVNVGRLLKPEWFADSRDFQTRVAVTRTETTTTWTNGTATLVDETTGLITSSPWAFVRSYYAARSGGCTPDPDDPVVYTSPEGAPYDRTESVSGRTRTTRWKTQTDAKREFKYQVVYSGTTCTVQRRINYGISTRTWQRIDNGTDVTNTVFDHWKYDKLPVNVGLLKSGTGWNSSFVWPVGPNGANKTINWDGCIEERQTVSQASYTPIPSGAKDLDIDSVPVAGDPTTQWGMVLPDLIYTRRGYNTWEWTLPAVDNVTDDYPNGSYYACPKPAKLLQSWTDPTDFDNYVDTLTPEGNTYHDIGLLWGARLMSPTGIFAASNALTPLGGEIDRHMIFMTDGNPCTDPDNYTAHGVNWFDRRTIGAGTDPGLNQNCTSGSPMTDQVNARTEALCTAIKNKNITLWVITFGEVAASTVTRMTNCATTGRYYSANNAVSLQATFQSIANQISQLRLTR